VALETFILWTKHKCNTVKESIRSDQHGNLKECCHSVHRWFTSISATMGSVILGQITFQECWCRAQRWITSISATKHYPGYIF
jgi:hypothetical protein